MRLAYLLYMIAIVFEFGMIFYDIMVYAVSVYKLMYRSDGILALNEA